MLYNRAPVARLVPVCKSLTITTKGRIIIMTSKYFEAKAVSAGVSGDDVNRRLRESRLGHEEPSPDWVDCKRIARCLWSDQESGTMHLDGYYHYAPKMTCRG